MINLDHVKQRVIGRTRIAVGRAASVLEADLRRTGPSDQGELNQKTTVKPSGPNRLTIQVGVEYASFVREGTDPHLILPHKQYLAFDWPSAPGQVRRLPDGRVLAKKVQHPGTDPNPWFDNAVKDLPRMVQSELDALGDSV